MTKLDFEGMRYRKKEPRPLHTEGEKADYKLKARQLAERIKKGKPGRKRNLGGPVRQFTPEEIAVYEASRAAGKDE